MRPRAGRQSSVETAVPTMMKEEAAIPVMLPSATGPERLLGTVGEAMTNQVVAFQVDTPGRRGPSAPGVDAHVGCAGPGPDAGSRRGDRARPDRPGRPATGWSSRPKAWFLSTPSQEALTPTPFTSSAVRECLAATRRFSCLRPPSRAQISSGWAPAATQGPLAVAGSVSTRPVHRAAGLVPVVRQASS